MAYSRSSTAKGKGIYDYYIISNYLGQQTDYGPYTYNVEKLNFSGTYGDGSNSWKTAIKEVRQAGTAMSISETKLNAGSFFTSGKRNEYYDTHPYQGWSERGYNATRYYIQYETGFINPSAPSSVLANNKALAGLIRNANSKVRALQGLVVAGEFSKTVRMLVNPLGAFKRRLSSYQRHVKKRARREKGLNRHKVIANTWLEANYGWRPLVRDIDDASKYLAEYTTNVARPPVAVVTGYGEDSKSTENHRSITYSHPYYHVRGRYSVKRTDKVRYKAALRVNQPRQYVHKSLGLGLNDFVPALWELTPYSFLVDYFSNVGDIVNAACFQSGQIAWCMKWIIYERELKLSFYKGDLQDDPIFYGYDNKLTGCSPASKRERTIGRSIYTGSFIPDFRLTMPDLWNQWLNIAALTRARF